MSRRKKEIWLVGQYWLIVSPRDDVFFISCNERKASFMLERGKSYLPADVFIKSHNSWDFTVDILVDMITRVGCKESKAKLLNPI